jgi:hypothetical protein
MKNLSASSERDVRGCRMEMMKNMLMVRRPPKTKPEMGSIIRATSRSRLLWWRGLWGPERGRRQQADGRRRDYIEKGGRIMVAMGRQGSGRGGPLRGLIKEQIRGERATDVVRRNIGV